MNKENRHIEGGNLKFPTMSNHGPRHGELIQHLEYNS